MQNQRFILIVSKKWYTILSNLKAATMKKVEDKLDELNSRLERSTAELRQEAERTIGDIQPVGWAWVLPHVEQSSPQIHETNVN